MDLVMGMRLRAPRFLSLSIFYVSTESHLLKPSTVYATAGTLSYPMGSSNFQANQL